MHSGHSCETKFTLGVFLSIKALHLVQKIPKSFSVILTFLFKWSRCPSYESATLGASKFKHKI